MDFETALLTLSRQGFSCSQILMKLALDLDGRDNPDLLRAVSGLTCGMGHTGHTCGVLTGGACVLGYFTGQGDPEELPHSRAREIVADYVDWFRTQYGTDGCKEILGGDFSRSALVCPAMIEAAYFKLVELLGQYGILEATL